MSETIGRNDTGFRRTSAKGVVGHGEQVLKLVHDHGHHGGPRPPTSRKSLADRYGAFGRGG